MTGLQSASEGTRVLCLTHLREANERPVLGAAPLMEPCAAWHRPGRSVFAGELPREPGSGRSRSAGEPPQAVLASHLLGVLGGPS